MIGHVSAWPPMPAAIGVMVRVSCLSRFVAKAWGYERAKRNDRILEDGQSIIARTLLRASFDTENAFSPSADRAHGKAVLPPGFCHETVDFRQRWGLIGNMRSYRKTASFYDNCNAFEL